MPRMITELPAKAHMRCYCGHLFKVRDGQGACGKCGATADEVLASRWRVCALNGCDVRFLPSGPGQRVCCDDHRKAYTLQLQRGYAARRRGEDRIGRERITLRDDACALGPRSAPRPQHVCAGYPGHKCKVRTADRRCPKCRAKWKAMHGI